MTTLDTVLTSIDMPTQSVPPPAPATWNELLADCSDGVWYLVKTYPSSGAARQTVFQQRRSKNLPPGEWEFRHGPHEGKFGVWARNVLGPRVGEDE